MFKFATRCIVAALIAFATPALAQIGPGNTTGTPRTGSYMNSNEFQAGQSQGITSQDFRDLITSLAYMAPATIMHSGAKCDGSTLDDMAADQAEYAAEQAGGLGAVQLPAGLDCRMSSQIYAKVPWFSLGQCGKLDWTGHDLGDGIAGFVAAAGPVAPYANLCLVGPGGGGYPGVGIKPAKMDGMEMGILHSWAPQSHFTNLDIRGFNRAFIVDTDYGHYLMDGHTILTGNYIGLDVLQGGGDNKISGVEATGNTLAAVAFENGGAGWAGGAIIKGVHFGFSPYGIIVLPGPGTGNIASSMTADEMHFESIGNAALKVESAPYAILDAAIWKHVGFSWDIPGLNGSSWTYTLGGAASPAAVTMTCTPTSGVFVLTCPTDPATAGFGYTMSITGTDIPANTFVAGIVSQGAFGTEPLETWSQYMVPGANEFTFSNGGLTVTGADATQEQDIVFGANAYSQWGMTRYSEHTVVANSTGTNGSSVGIGLADTNANMHAFLGSDTHGIAYYPYSGNVYYNNAIVQNIAACPVGGVVEEAVNVALRKVWFACNGGPWEGSGSDSPATGVGGFSFGFYPPFYDAFQTGVNGAGLGKITSNFGPTFAFTKPTLSQSYIVMSQSPTASPGAETVTGNYGRPYPIDIASGDVEGTWEIYMGDYPFTPGTTGKIFHLAYAGENAGGKLIVHYDGPPLIYTTHDPTGSSGETYAAEPPASASGSLMQADNDPYGFVNNSRIDTASGPSMGNFSLSIPAGDLAVSYTTVASGKIADSWSSTTQTSGLHYFDVTVTNNGNNSAEGVAVVPSSTGNTVNVGSNSFLVTANGNVFINGSYSTTISGLNDSSGDSMRIAIDQTNNKVWVEMLNWAGAVEGNGWDNNASDNPATNQGGYTIASGQTYKVGLVINASGGAVNNGAFAFNFSGPFTLGGGLPSGASAWGGTLNPSDTDTTDGLALTAGATYGQTTFQLDQYAFSIGGIVPDCHPTNNPGGNWWISTPTLSGGTVTLQANLPSMPTSNAAFQCTLAK